MFHCIKHYRIFLVYIVHNAYKMYNALGIMHSTGRFFAAYIVFVKYSFCHIHNDGSHKVSSECKTQLKPFSDGSWRQLDTSVTKRVKKHHVVFSKIFKCPDPNMADYFYHNLHTETYIMFANTYVSVSVSAYLFTSLTLWKMFVWEEIIPI